MSNRRRENLQEATPGSRIARLWVVVGGLLLALGSVVGGGLGNLGGVFGLGVVVFVVGASVRGLCRGSQAPAGVRAVLPPAPRLLRWVGGLLPGSEGTAWLAELSSCLAEARDQSERRRYIRSYRRNVPQLVWTSWVVRLSGSRRELL